MLLMEEAERIAKDEHGSNKISVISGIKQLPDMIVFDCSCIEVRVCLHVVSLAPPFNMSGNETSL